MMTGVLTMSEKELDRLTMIERFLEKRVSQKDAAAQLNITTRHFRRLVNSFKTKGRYGLCSKRRAKRSNNSTCPKFKEMVERIVREEYSDYGPTLAAERLKLKYGLTISRESLRQWMIEWGLWVSKRRKATVVHQPRYRVSRVGELIQIDGSPHRWFEDRGEACTLLLMVDDATSQIMQMRLASCESTFNYFDIFNDYVIQYGKPVAIYSDKHVVFKVNAKEAKSGNGLTQFGRALKSLGTKIIYANSPQAKGRVERANRVLQDRLVKRFREEGISDIESANVFLEQFRIEYNQQFAKQPRCDEDAHMPLTEIEKGRLPEIFSLQSLRKVDKNLLVRYKNSIYKIINTNSPASIRNRGVVVIENAKGEISIRCGNKHLDYEIHSEEFYDGEVLTLKELHQQMNVEASSYKPDDKLDKVNIFLY